MDITNKHLDSALIRLLKQVKQAEPIYLPYFECMYHLGCRVSEVIDLNRWEKLNEDYFVLTPSKKNNQRIFKTNSIPQSFLFLLNNPEYRTNFINYSKLSYSFKKHFIYGTFYIGMKQSRLHLFRHNYTKKLLEQNYTNTEIKDILGERNQRSADAYIYSQFSSYPTELHY